MYVSLIVGAEPKLPGCLQIVSIEESRQSVWTFVGARNWQKVNRASIYCQTRAKGSAAIYRLGCRNPELQGSLKITEPLDSNHVTLDGKLWHELIVVVSP